MFEGLLNKMDRVCNSKGKYHAGKLTGQSSSAHIGDLSRATTKIKHMPIHNKKKRGYY